MRADIHDGQEQKLHTGRIHVRKTNLTISKASCDARPVHTLGQSEPLPGPCEGPSRGKRGNSGKVRPVPVAAPSPEAISTWGVSTADGQVHAPASAGKAVCSFGPLDRIHNRRR